MAELTTSQAPPDRLVTLRMDTVTRDGWQDRAQAAGLHVVGFAGPVRGGWIPYLYSCGCPGESAVKKWSIVVMARAVNVVAVSGVYLSAIVSHNAYLASPRE